MNARQKAKHYKKLYEQSKVPYNKLELNYTELNHYKVKQSFPPDIPDKIKSDYITRAIIEQTFPIIQGAIKAEKSDWYDDRLVYSLDFWILKGGIDW